ncbi:LacI family DNA-binding transcriptional regulator [Bengtsoniella intestinalis]|uniref:LacI family DNA-binding transcriptional regulator n=1 Tax=Bengtsoniella intestinalis TaxID=3073143 RepID=UPI00391EE232
MATTVKDVATMAGISASTVSRVLNGSSHVSQSTREKVMRAVEVLNYSPNTLAQGLKGGNSRVIGLIMPYIGTSITNYATCGVEQAARERGYTVMLCNTNESLLSEKEHVELLIKRGVDGIIFATVTKSLAHQDHIRTVFESGLPVVNMIRRMKAGSQVPTVTIDNYQCGYDVAEEVIRQGGRHVVIVEQQATFYLYDERVDGCVDALQNCGIKPVILSSATEISAYLASGAALDHVIAVNDSVAAKTITSIVRAGKCVPQDIGVFGFGDLEISRLYNPSISTVKQPFTEVGNQACHLLIDKIENPTLEQEREILLQGELIVRESSR